MLGLESTRGLPTKQRFYFENIDVAKLQVCIGVCHAAIVAGCSACAQAAPLAQAHWKL